jgi:2-keto-4-pentenoate hydratase/2-oxohepta-3-ene-1,7-dioic acid hydratase in catechol pathway
MKLLKFVDAATSAVTLGVEVGHGVVDLRRVAPGLGSLPALMAGGPAALERLATMVQQADEDSLAPESMLELLPPVDNPEKIIGIGLNYRRHALETGLPLPKTPILFAKFNNSLAAPDEVIPLPETATQVDYEVELAVVIGREARNVPESKALDYVFGYATANDLSARDLQTRTPQWLLGKTLDKFLPLGPYLVTADEVPDPQNLTLKCWVNNQLRQDSNTSDMIFGVAEVISYISRHFTLTPGDVISTGTPEGVIMGMADKVWLKQGDEVSVEVEGLGRLTNVLG